MNGSILKIKINGQIWGDWVLGDRSFWTRLDIYFSFPLWGVYVSPPVSCHPSPYFILLLYQICFYLTEIVFNMIYVMTGGWQEVTGVVLIFKGHGGLMVDWWLVSGGLMCWFFVVCGGLWCFCVGSCQGWWSKKRDLFWCESTLPPVNPGEPW